MEKRNVTSPQKDAIKRPYTLAVNDDELRILVNALIQFQSAHDDESCLLWDRARGLLGRVKRIAGMITEPFEPGNFSEPWRCGNPACVCKEQEEVPE